MGVSAMMVLTPLLLMELVIESIKKAGADVTEAPSWASGAFLIALLNT